MILILAIAGLLLLVLLPQWWVKRVFAQYQGERDDFPGTGGQLAEHVIHALQIQQASVEMTELSNHFNPESKTVALTPLYYRGKSLTAITVAAHEVGHLLQLEEGNAWLSLRTQLVYLTQKLETIGRIALVLLPVAGIVTRSPAVILALTGVALSSVVMNVVVHLVTLPMELDASFGKALPLLKTGKFITTDDEPNVRQILWAAAFTYLASALSSLLNLANWLRILRR